MKIVGVEFRIGEPGMRESVRTAAGTHAERPVGLLRIVAEEAEGWGECGALKDASAVDAGLGDVWEYLSGPGVGRLFDAAKARGGTLPRSDQIAALFGMGSTSRFAAATVEMAVLDAELRSVGASLADRLGERFTERGASASESRRVRAGAVVGIPPGRDSGVLLANIGRKVADGFFRVRVKIEPGWDRLPLAAARHAYPDLALHADANGSYRIGSGGVDDARRLETLDELDLVCIEQPFEAADLGAHALLAERLNTPIALDESLSTLAELKDALRQRACAVACLKPARLGGLAAAAQAQSWCRDAGVDAFVGGMFENGLGRSANAALATLPGFTLPGDLSAPREYLYADPFAYPKVEGGWATVHPGPGVAPEPDLAALAGCSDASTTRWLRYPA